MNEQLLHAIFESQKDESMRIIRESLDLYVKNRIPPGGFLMAVLCNDLVDAVGRADATNKLMLPEIVACCYNELPSDCWGSPENVKEWLNSF